MTSGILDSRRILLAPMAGVTDAAFRALCIEQGAELTYTEMVSAKGLSYANEKTRHLLRRAENEHKVAVQLFGHEAAVMADQAASIEHALDGALACIDINMGCPARKIVSKGDGAALMKSPEVACTIVSRVKTSVSVPVSVKFRRGWSNEEGESAPVFAQMLEEAGADILTVHGRFATQMYQGHADWGCIARVRAAVSIPLVGNGDITCAADAVRMVEETGCDAVMVARASEGNPWIFSEIRAAFDGDVAPATPSITERINLARRHAEMLSRLYDGHLGRMRKHAMWYLHGIPGARAARGRIAQCSTLDDFNRVFDSIVNACSEGGN